MSLEQAPSPTQRRTHEFSYDAYPIPHGNPAQKSRREFYYDWGRLPADLMRQIDDAIRVSLGLA